MYVAPNTAAATFEYIVSDECAHLVIASGLAGAEELVVKIWNGADWQVVYDDAGAAVECTVAKPNVRLPGLGHYQISKGVTVGAVGIAVT